MSKNTVFLRGDNEADIRRAATFIAQLVREGVTFEATDDILSNPARTGSEPGYVVTLTGGY